MTSLVINVLTREQAENLKEGIFFFSKEAKIVHGNFTNTWGLKIPFSSWITRPTIQSCFLNSDKIKKIIGLNPSELMYYEFDFLKNSTKYEEVEFEELFSRNSLWKLNKTFSFYSTSKNIYFKDKIISCYDDIISSDALSMKEGLSKLYRRGYLSDEIRAKWRLKFGDILEY